MNPNSLYFVIYSDLKQRILDGTFESGEKLPGEADLEKLYKASRAPVRQALALLEQEAYIIRMRGKGTFVTDRKQKSLWLLNSGFSKAMLDNFEALRCRTISISQEEPDGEVRKILGLEEEQYTIHIRRLRFFNELPVFSIHNYFRETMNIEAFRKAGDFFLISEVLERLFHISLHRSDEEIWAKTADEETASYMGVKPGFPLLGVRRIYYGFDDRTIFMSRYDVRTDIWTYTNTYSSSIHPSME